MKIKIIRIKKIAESKVTIKKKAANVIKFEKNCRETS